MFTLVTILAACAAVAAPPPSTRPATTLPTGDARVPGRPYVEALEPDRFRVPDPPGDLPLSRPPVAIQMVYIPAGRFMMGSPEGEKGRQPNEGPRHEVELDGFWIARFEVTNDVYAPFESWTPQSDRRRIGRKDPRATPRMVAADAIDKPGPPDHAAWFRGDDLAHPRRPARGMTQYAAQQFCRWLTVRTGRLYRLPTEAEWEYAARAGCDARYFFGDAEAPLDRYAWLTPDRGRDEFDRPHEVGLKEPNRWGLYDVCGNVAEWTLDGWSGDYRGRARPGHVACSPWTRRGDEGDAGHGVVRGGSCWRDGPAAMRSAARAKRWDGENTDGEIEWYDFSDRGRWIGFRVVSPVAPPKKPDGRESSIRSNFEAG